MLSTRVKTKINHLNIRAMKKSATLFLATLMLLVVLGAKGQSLTTYTLNTDNQPYVSISATGTQLTSVVGDGGSQNLAMPFDFNFGETTITQGATIRVRSDGHVVLSNATGNHYGSNYCNGSTPAIVPLLLEDGQMPAGSSACYWQVDTTSDGLLVLVFEFQHVQQYNSPGDDFNYQLRLFENGNVSVHYGHLLNTLGRDNFDLLMVSVPIDNVADQVALYGTWESPSAGNIGSLSHGNNAVSPINGLPDSGLVVTFERPEPPCPRPRNIRIAELTASSATLMWTPNEVNGCTYMIAYDTTWIFYMNLDRSVKGMTDDSVFYLDSLLSNHHYYVYLKSHCGSDSSGWQSFEFWTPCEPISHLDLPFTEDFQSYTSTTPSLIFDPGCWRRSNLSGFYVTTQGPSNHRCLTFMANGAVGLVALPPFEDPSDLEITFEANIQNATLQVGVLDDPSDWNSFVPVQTVNLPNSTWAERSVRLMSYTGMGNTVAFRLEQIGTSVSRAYIDNVDVHLAMGCPAVETVNVSEITANTVTVGWTDPNHVGSYTVTYRPVSSIAPISVTTTDTSVNLTGLIPDEDYVVMVYSECSNGTGNAVSATFRTRCSLRAVPFTENFEAIGIPNCWYAAGLRFTSSNPVGDLAPMVCDTNATSGSRSLCLVSKRTNLVGREAAWAVMPETSIPVDRLMLDFDYQMPEWYENVELAVGVTTTESDTSGFTRIATFYPANGDWNRYHVDLALYNGTSGRIAFFQHNISDHTYSPQRRYDYGFLDSVVVSELPSCAHPLAVYCTGITSSSVDVSWIEANSVGTYEVTCGTQIQMVSGTTQYTFTGLSPQTTYTVSVRQLCTEGFTEARTATFTTECAGISTLPWTEDFESWPEDSFDPCWTRHEGPDSYSSVRLVNASFLQPEPHAILMRAEIWQGDTNRSFLVLPPVTIPYADISYSMNVMGSNSSSNNTLLELGILTDGADRTTFTVFDTVPFTNGLPSTWDYYERSLAGIGNGRLTLRMTSLNGSHSLYVDNISLFYVTSCSYPDALNVDSVSLNTISVSVADDDSVGHYRLWWSTESLTDSADFTGYSYTITGLQHSTRYQLSVATICPSDGTLSTRTGTAAATACGIITHTDLPYEENYDNGIGLCSSFIDYRFPGNSGDRTNPNYYHGASGKSLCPNVGDNSQPFFYILPEVDSLNGLALEFWYYIERYTQHDMITVGVMTAPADTTTFTAIQTIYPNIASQWELRHVSLGTYNGPGGHVALRFGICNGTWSWIPRIDDLSLVFDLSCLAPDSVTIASVTDTSATLVVHDPRQVGHYRLYTPTDTTDFYGDTMVIEGLTVATDYTLRVASLCTDGNATFPVQVSFTTDCGLFSLPYLEGFDNQQLYNMPRCWTVKDSATYLPSVRSNSNGGQALCGNLRSSDSIVSFTTPLLHFADTDVYIDIFMRVDQYATDSNYHAHQMPLHMQLTYIGDTLGNAIVLFDDTLSPNPSSMETTLQHIEINTSDIPRGDGLLCFAFLRDSTATNALFVIDSLSVSTIHHDPPCQPVASLNVNDITLDAVHVGWIPQGVETQWELHLFNSIVDSLVFCDTSEVVIKGLEQDTRYTLSVRPLCTDGQLLWSDTLEFTTLECPAVFDVSVSNITAHTALVSWQAPTSGPWIVTYGASGFLQGQGETVIVPSPAEETDSVTFLLENLAADTTYDLYVRTLCTGNKMSVWSDRVSFSTTLDGITEIGNSKTNIEIYPNPTHGKVTVTSPDPLVSATVTDMMGRRVYIQTIRQSGNQSFTFDLSSCPQGAYFLTLITVDGRRHTVKLIKQSPSTHQ